jgi:hypothetical protein
VLVGDGWVRFRDVFGRKRLAGAEDGRPGAHWDAPRRCRPAVRVAHAPSMVDEQLIGRGHAVSYLSRSLNEAASSNAR